MPATDISIVTEQLPDSQVGLTIEVPSERVDDAYDRVLNRLSQRVKIGGFRPGKAPRPLVEARVGAAALREEVVDFLVPPLVSEALKERSIDAIDRPQVEIQELERGRPARLLARVSVWPEVTLPELGGLDVARETTEVDDAMVETRLTALRERLAEVEPVEREVRNGDIVVGDMHVSVDGEEIPEESRTAMEMEVRDGVLVPELLAALPGKNVGDVAEADVAMPDDHSNEKVRGRTARLQVTIQGVKEKRVPELTDEVAEQISGGDQKTPEALREWVREDMVKSAAHLDRLALERRAVDALVEAARVDIPKALVDREVSRQLEDLEHNLGHRGLKLDRYLEYRKQTQTEWRAEHETDARGRIRTDLVLEELGKQLDISPTEDEVTQYMREEGERDPELSKNLESMLSSNVARDFFRHRLTRLRIVDALVSKLDGGAVELKKG